MQDFLIHKKAVPYAVKPEADNGPYYLKSTIDYIKYLVTEMADQPITGRTLSTNGLYTSTESLDAILQHLGHCRKGEAEYHLNFLTPRTESFSVQFVILKRRRRTFAWNLDRSKQSQKERKILLCYWPPDHCIGK